MSVTEDNRKEGKLKVCVLARKVANHTLVVTANEKIFVPRFQKLTDELIKTALGISMHCWTANNIRVTCRDDWLERNRLQKLAVRECDELLALIDIARPQFHLRLQKVRHWGLLAVEAKQYIKAWNEKDKARYSKFC